MEELIEIIEKYKQEYEADGVKVYYHTKNDYCIKFIKGEQLVKVVRKGRSRGWDIQKKPLKN